MTLVINFLFLITVLYINLHGFSVSYLVRGLLKIGLATAALTALLWFCLAFFDTWLHGTVVQQGTALFALITSAATLYGVVLHFLKLGEMTVLTEKVLGKFHAR